MRTMIAVTILTTLAACGGGGGGTSSRGEIYSACMDSDRKRATASLCSCIQRTAHQTLKGSDQSRAAKFFTDPDKAQKTRARDDFASESFWKRYKAFTQAAERSCR